MWKVIVIGFLSLIATSTCLNFDSLINGGNDATPHQFPFAVAVRTRNINYSPRLCGGALISRQAILTTGFCVYGQTDPEVFLGAHNLEDENEMFQVRMLINPQDIYVHESYKSGELMNDIAVVRLPAAIAFFNNAINMIAIPSDPAEVFVNISSTIMGFGSNCFHISCPELNVLRTIDVFVRPNVECDHVTTTDGTQLCVTNALGGPCRGND